MNESVPLAAANALLQCGLKPPLNVTELRRENWTRLVRSHCGVGSSSHLVLMADASAPDFIRHRLRHEHEIAPLLEPGFSVGTQTLFADGDGLCLLLRDPGGETLASNKRKVLNTCTVFDTALQITMSLESVHSRGLLHNDIRPGNILLREDGMASLIGFGMASRIGTPHAGLVLTESTETLPYMSPELSGRMNRTVDFRSDLYALGVVLYELVAGHLPFKAESPMEWVHCHVARAPIPLTATNVECPAQLLAIIDKLLAKAAEDRFQTAAAVIESLKQAGSDWLLQVPKAWTPHDFAEQTRRLATPQRLYDRNAQVEVLTSAYDRVVETGNAELLLVKGHSGVGKSSVVQELRRHILANGSIFAAGKFEQSQTAAPYATLAESLGTVLADIRQRGDVERSYWKQRIQTALGPNAAILHRMLPELEALLGGSSAPAEMSPTDAAKRFQMALAKLVTALSEAGKPLVLFIDDLQWVDEETLEVLVELSTHDDIKNLLLVGAYRDNEIGQDHPLHRLTSAAREHGLRTTVVPLKGLSSVDLQEMLVDAFNRTREHVAPIAAFLHERTGGNPFFALQLIRALADDGLLKYDTATSSWTWHLAAIYFHEHKSDVREFLAGKMDRLSTDLRTWIEVLSCLGSTATKACMVAAFGKGTEEWGAQAKAAEEAGFIVRSSDTYRFIHDRTQEAAYLLIPDAMRPARHLEIGRRLGSLLSPPEIEAHIFDVVNQFARGIELIHDTGERLQVAAWFRTAGERAKAETAYEVALRHLESADALLTNERWLTAYPLAMAVAMATAECSFLTGSLQAAESQLRELQQQAQNTVDRAAITWLQVTLYTALDSSDLAIQTCLDFLSSVAISIPSNPTDDEVDHEYKALIQHMDSNGGVRSLLDLPTAADAEHRATLDALASMLAPAFFSNPNLVCYALCRMARLSLVQGNGDASALAYAYLGMVIGPRFSAYALAYELGRVGYELVERRTLNRYRGRVYMTFAYHVCPWTKPLSNSLDLLRRAYQIARDGGDVTYAGFSSCTLITTLLSHGTHLAEVQKEARERLRYVNQAKFGLVSDIITAQLQLIASLRGETHAIGSLDDDHFSESECEKRLTANHNLAIATCWYWLRKAHARFLTNRFHEALEAVEQAEPLLWTSSGHFEMAQYHFGAALIRTACFHDATEERREELMRHITAHLKQLRIWAEHGPATFEHRVALVEAEIANIQGREMDAMRGFERAIEKTRLPGNQQIIALTLETASRFCRRVGLNGIADGYLAQARDEYFLWGATGKVAAMEDEHPQIRGLVSPLSPVNSSSSAFADADVAAILKTSQVVSHDAGLDELMCALMGIALEHAGANRGVLIMPKGDQLRIEAVAHFEADGAKVKLQSLPISSTELPLSILQHVIKTAGAVLIDDARQSPEFSADPYFAGGNCRSVLCLPLIRQNELIAVLYLENSLVTRVFTQSRVSLLNLLIVTAALYIENASLEEKESLLKEVHHRVKNNLQLISSLLSLQAANIDDPRVSELFSESRNRVRTMAMVHENLYRAGNFARVPMLSHIRNLCAELTRAYGAVSQRIEVTVDVEDVQLDLDRAVSCGLIINELLSNALKYAFQNRANGRVHVGLRVVDAHCALRVFDDGIGLPGELDVTKATTLGLQLVDDLAAQLHGSLTVSNLHGADFTVRFPLSDARVYG